MLARRDHDAVDRGVTPKLGDDGGELDHLRTGAENRDDSHPPVASPPTRRVFAQPTRPRTSRNQAITEAIVHRYA